ncbi:NAD(P)/FAD-dependent oxidoreductase [Goodfellowiella coeruleoviolacea]|uniref:NADH dehydrogenase n=1 Tax=Goodfellowiella coeruleoviolacea TaxID=334858 RepID=A0AAE3KDC0_9PSEU|nr:NAD(P)/FAD-dependent oxidoreductase [Goodfellowiella coeruleoviolacea]MCP2163881.1 NADH dehydrogenase [Goodfellowiella coeruleoviolacea]
MSDDVRVGGRRRPRILVIGTGFAGYHCLRTLERRLAPDEAELIAVNPTDYMLYVPLLPEVSGGALDPRRVAVPLRTTLPRTRLVLGNVVELDLAAHTCGVLDVEGRKRTLAWDRVVITSGSVTRLLSIPGVAEHAKGFKTVAEGVFLRDHVLRQLELAELAEDVRERAARTTFVVVGAGYSGTEVVAQGHELTRQALRDHGGIREQDLRWVLVDMADRVLPGLDERLSGPAEQVLRERGVEVRLKTSVSEVTRTCVRLTDGSEIPTRTVVWCVGVRPDPHVEKLGLPTEKGRLLVDEHLTVPDHPDVFAAGDVAGVHDAYHPGRLTPMTAQHAQRQGRIAGINVAASLGRGQRRPYRHRDLGFVVDLARGAAVADPLHVPLRGWPAKLVARAYHLLAMPANRLRVLADWCTDMVVRRQVVQFGMVSEHGVSLAEADQIPAARAAGQERERASSKSADQR